MTAASKAAVRDLDGGISFYDMTIVCPIETVTPTTATATSAVAPSPIETVTPTTTTATSAVAPSPIETVTPSPIETVTPVVTPSPTDLPTPAIARTHRRILPKLDVCDRMEINYEHQHTQKTAHQLIQDWDSSESNIHHILLPASIDKNEVTFHHHLEILHLYDKNMEIHAIKQHMYAERGVVFSEYAISTIIRPVTALKHKNTCTDIVRRARKVARTVA
jgi:hypothetical protein